jgi:hypothetical protein
VALQATLAGYRASLLTLQVSDAPQSVKLKLKRKPSGGPRPQGDLMEVPQLSRDAYSR